MKIKIETKNFNLRWQVEDERLNVIRPLLDLIGQPESVKVKLTFLELIKYTWARFIAKITNKKINLAVIPEEDTPLGIG